MTSKRADTAGDTPKPPRPITREWLFRAAAYYLERYSSSTANLRRVLERKVMRRAHARGEDAGAFSDEIDETVAKFVELKLVDDRAYGEARVLSLRRRGTSQRMVAAKLSEKGVERDLVEELLAADETSDRQAAFAYARRRRLGPHRLRHRAERR
ncbi:MAG: RecX family transcriptional regulator, partial [Aurantimonas coralicida]